MRYPVKILDDGEIAFTKKTNLEDMTHISLAIKAWIQDNNKEVEYGTRLIRMLFEGDTDNELDL